MYGYWFLPHLPTGRDPYRSNFGGRHGASRPVGLLDRLPISAPIAGPLFFVGLEPIDHAIIK